jgi:O-antigen ligase
MPLDKNKNLPETIGIYCLYLLVGALPLVFLYQSFDIFELAKLTFLRLITLTMIGAWMVMCFRSRRFIIARTPVDYFVLAYLGIYTLATIFSGNPRISLLGEYGRFEGLLTIYNYVAVFFLAGIFIRENNAVPDKREFIRGLLLTMLGGATLVSLYGVVQRFGLDFLAWSSAGTDTTRAFSTLGNPIYVAAYLTIVIPIALVLFYEDKSLNIRLAIGAALSLVVAALVLTFSRAGWAGALVSIAVLGILGLVEIIRKRPREGNQGRMPHRSHSSTVAMTERSKKQHSQLPIYVALVLVIVMFTGGVVVLSAGKASGPTKSAVARVLTVFDFGGPAYADRVSMWKSSIAMIKDRPLLGYGPEMFGTFYTKYRRMDIVTFEREVSKLPRPRYQNRPHMDILQQGVSAGVLGMLVYAAVWAAFFWFGIRRSRDLLSIGIIAGLVGYIFQVQFSFNTIAVTPLVWLGMAFVFSLTADREPQTAKPAIKNDRSVLNIVFQIVGAVTLIGLAILSVRPIIADCYFDQGVTAFEHQDSFVAQNDIDVAISFNPYEPDYANYGASSFVDMAKKTTDANVALGLLLQSIDYANQAVKLNPDNAGYKFNLANAEYLYSTIPGMDAAEAKNTMMDARTNFIFAVKNDPYMSDYRFNLASAYLRFEQKAEAIDQIKAGLRIDPTRVDAKAWLATLTKGAGL